MNTTYKLYKYVEGEYYLWGEYTNPVKLAEASFELGSLGVRGIRVEVEENPNPQVPYTFS